MPVLDTFNEDNKDVLHTRGEYVVSTCIITDPMLEADTLVYGVYHTMTKVREAEARQLHNAIALCNGLADALNSSEESVAEVQQELPLH